MINKNYFIFMDFETGSRNPMKTQPIELAAIAIHPRTLEIVPNSEFLALIKPIFDEEKCISLNIDPLEKGALDVNKKTVEQLQKDGKSLKSVWREFTQYCNNFNSTGKRWDAPILCGFNNNNFDDKIINRICGSKPWEFGPWDEERMESTLFHPTINVDLYKIVFSWFENVLEPQYLSMDSLRDYFGISKEGSHEALKDVLDGAEILTRFLKMQRTFNKKVQFKGSFEKR